MSCRHARGIDPRRFAPLPRKPTIMGFPLPAAGAAPAPWAPTPGELEERGSRYKLVNATGGVPVVLDPRVTTYVERMVEPRSRGRY